MSPLIDLDPLLPGDEETATTRDAFVRELERPASAAASRRARLVPRRGPALAAAVALGLAAAFVIPRLGGSDAVESARAAMVFPGGGILHVKVRYEHGPFVGMANVSDGPHGPVRGQLTGDTERWTATEPFRQREVSFLKAPDGDRETMQTAYSPKSTMQRNSWDHRTVREPLDWRQVKEMEAVRRRLATGLGSVTTTLQEDPIAAIRVLFNAGVLRDDGTEEWPGGGEVRRLVGTSGGYSSGGWHPKASFEYLVDAETFVPRQVTAVQVLPAQPDAEEPAARKKRKIVDRWVFETFERLPLNDQTAKLLRIDPDA